ncbi:hypothetical protein DIPPA_26510 [Diplonema papillatum]|nr:hypothetical protein DIPPA_26510 [Diplonema papillatum]
MVRSPVAHSLSSTRRVRCASPSYSDFDLGIGKELSNCDAKCKKALGDYSQVKARLQLLQAEESRINIKLRKAEVLQRAFDQKREVLEHRDNDQQRLREAEEHDRLTKEAQRNSERDRKERAREKMEATFMTRRTDVMRYRMGWEQTKRAYSAERESYTAELSERAKEDKMMKSARRQNLQDDLDDKLLKRAESRATERRRNADAVKARREKESQLRASFAREQREAARACSMAHFENRVTEKKGAVLESVRRKVDTSKSVASDLSKEMEKMLREESKLRDRIMHQKILLEETTPACTPHAISTPYLIRSPRR